MSLKDFMGTGSKMITIIGVLSQGERTLSFPLSAFPVWNSMRLVQNLINFCLINITYLERDSAVLFRPILWNAEYSIKNICSLYNDKKTK